MLGLQEEKWIGRDAVRWSWPGRNPDAMEDRQMLQVRDGVGAREPG